MFGTPRRGYAPRVLRLILDVDTGIDDAFALLLAARHPDVELVGVTCVDGNAPLEDVVRNTIAVLDAAGRPDVPVIAGAHRPLLADPDYAPFVHGTDGLAELAAGWPASREPEPGHAVTWLRDTLLGSAEPITLVTLAPLTNVALLLRTHPEVVSRIGRLVVMGGSATAGNVSALAEFNVHHDPEAAAIVFGSDIPITMYGLDVFTQVVVPEGNVRAMAQASDPGTRLTGEVGVFLGDRLGWPLGIGDAGAVCAAIEPDGLTTASLRTAVVTHPGPARGMTLVDRRSPYLAAERPAQARHIDVALEVDAARYADLWLATVRRP